MIIHYEYNFDVNDFVNRWIQEYADYGEIETIKEQFERLLNNDLDLINEIRRWIRDDVWDFTGMHPDGMPANEQDMLQAITEIQREVKTRILTL
jgi:hypothetical protein